MSLRTELSIALLSGALFATAAVHAQSSSSDTSKTSVTSKERVLKDQRVRNREPGARTAPAPGPVGRAETGSGPDKSKTRIVSDADQNGSHAKHVGEIP